LYVSLNILSKAKHLRYFLITRWQDADPSPPPASTKAAAVSPAQEVFHFSRLTLRDEAAAADDGKAASPIPVSGWVEGTRMTMNIIAAVSSHHRLQDRDRVHRARDNGRDTGFR
jgi:hypothetical protein